MSFEIGIEKFRRGNWDIEGKRKNTLVVCSGPEDEKMSYEAGYKGFSNPKGSYNCFINVILQSLWHLASFRWQFLSQGEHKHSSPPQRSRYPYPDRENTRELKEINMSDHLVNTVPSSTAPPTNIDMRTRLPPLDLEPHSPTTKEYELLQEEYNSGVPLVVFQSRLEEEDMEDITQIGINNNVAKEDFKDIVANIKYSADNSVPMNSIDTKGASIISCVNINPIYKPNWNCPVKSDLCLICSIRDLFIKYQLDERLVLPPGQVRMALASLNTTTQKGYTPGNMGCAVETFEEILRHLHRDYVFPIYSSLAVQTLFSKSNKGHMYKIENTCDDVECLPSCPAHRTFAIKLKKKIMCLNCKKLHLTPGSNSVSNEEENLCEYSIRVYISDIQKYLSTELSFGEILKLVANPALTNRKTTCSFCKFKEFHVFHTCSHLPLVVPISIEWGSDEPHKSKSNVKSLRQIYNKIVPILDISSIYQVKDKGEQDQEYVFRGFIVYSLHHYLNFFYSPYFDCWLQFDDEIIRRFRNFDKVIEYCILGKFYPILLFYESISFIVHRTKYVSAPLVPVEGDNMNMMNANTYYFENMDKNNFWRQPSKKSKACIIF